MHFLFQILSLMWIVKCLTVATSSDSMFSVMPLGSSALLISWSPDNFKEDLADDTVIKFLRFEYVIKGQENKSFSKVTARRIETGQVKINLLLENSTYRITVTKMIISGNFLLDAMSQQIGEGYVIEGKTKLDTNSPPGKPDFSYEYIDKKYLSMSITWIPCGQERNCQGFEPGTHYYVTYKCIETGEQFTMYEYFNDFLVINFVLPGRTYSPGILEFNPQ